MTSPVSYFPSNKQLLRVSHHIDESTESLHGHQLVVARIGLATYMYVQIRIAASIYKQGTLCRSGDKQFLSLFVMTVKLRVYELG